VHYIRAMIDPDSPVEIKRRELRAFIKSRGLQMKPWARAAKVSSGTVRNFLDGRSKTMTQATIDALAKAADASPADMFPSSYPHNFRGNQSPSITPINLVAGETTGRVTVEPGGERRFEGPGDLPILGHVKAGEMGLFITNGERQGVTVRLKALEGVQDAYAVRVHDRSMYPAFEPDDLVQVNPHLSPQPGHNVVIQLVTGEAFIKLLVRRTEKEIRCKQWNPEKDVTFDPKQVRSIHRIVRPT